VLNLRESDYYDYGNLENETVGAGGYLLLDWQGTGTRLTNLPASLTVAYVPVFVWKGIADLDRQFKVGNELQTNITNWGWEPFSTIASLTNVVSDTNFHFLTVASPNHEVDQRVFTLRLTSDNDNTSAAYSVNEGNAIQTIKGKAVVTIGSSHMYQFLFRGNATLWADASASGGTNAIVQGLFFDDAPVTYLPASPASIDPATIDPATLPALTGATMLGDGAFQLSFSYTLPWSISVLTSTNLLLPLTNWTRASGALSNIAPGQFQFTTPPMAGDTQRFYAISLPQGMGHP
jgi:hypothetical protein